MIERRAFMKSGALALFASGFGGLPSFIAQAANSNKIIQPYKKNKTLVCIFQRGAMDGLMTVSPYADANLKSLRPSLYMSPSEKQGGLIDLDGQFGLHPAMAALSGYFTSKQMAIVHGVGSPNNTRSHFDAQDYMEAGTPYNKGTASGWLNRAVGLMGHEASPFRAVSLTNSLPRSLYGDNEALAISNLQDFAIQARNTPIAMNSASKSFEQLYDQTSNSLLSKTGKESFDALKMLNINTLKNYQPAKDIVYPLLEIL